MTTDLTREGVKPRCSKRRKRKTVQAPSQTLPSGRPTAPRGEAPSRSTPSGEAPVSYKLSINPTDKKPAPSGSHPASHPDVPARVRLGAEPLHWKTVPPLHRKGRKTVKSDWYFHALNLLLVGLMIHFGWATLDRLSGAWNPDHDSAPTVSASPMPEPGILRRGASRIDAYRVIWVRNLFASAPQLVWDPARDALHAVPLAGSEQGLTLIGTTVSPRSELTFAVIDSKMPAGQGIYRARDRVGRTTIVAIQRNQVIVETESGERLRLSVGEEAPSGGGIRRAAGIRPAVVSSALPTPAAGDVPHVPVAEVAASFSNPQRVIEEAIISEHLGDGNPDGFYLGRLRAADVLYRIGLRTGDFVKGVDEIEFAGPGDAENFLSRLSEGGRVSVHVNRRGVERNVEVLIN